MRTYFSIPSYLAIGFSFVMLGPLAGHGDLVLIGAFFIVLGVSSWLHYKLGYYQGRKDELLGKPLP